MGIASRELQHCNNRNSESRAIATPHFDHQVKEACLSYAERQQSSTKSTLQQRVQSQVSLELCRAPAVVDEVNTAMLRAKIIAEKRKISCEVFVNRNQKFLPLQCQIEIADRRSLRVKIARVKSRNCAH